MKGISLAIALGFFIPVQGKEAKDPTIAIKADMGVSIRRPPKNDEWDFKEKGGFFSNSLIVVAHKVDTITVEVFAQDKLADLGSNDLKKAAEAEYKHLAGSQGIMDPKQITTASSKLPGGGGGNAPTAYLEMSFKREEKPTELRMWVFKGNNGFLYKILMVNDEGMYKKHQKMADFILSSVQVFRPPK
jgi:hypothetical protein